MAFLSRSSHLFEVYKAKFFRNSSCLLQSNQLCIKNLLIKRYLPTTNHSEQNTLKPFIGKEDLHKFEKVFPDIVDDLMKSTKCGNITEVASRFDRSLQYNVPHGKKNRGLMVVSSYNILEKPDELTQENIHLAHILGWSVEMLQAFFLLMDDVVDGSETRRNQLCWSKLEDVGLLAINDALLLESSVYFLLKKYFSLHPSYVDIVELFHEVTRMTVIGQIMDSNIVSVNHMSLERFESIVYHKTAYYSFYLPVALAMYLSKLRDPELHREVRQILLEIGKFFQAQDDFLDCFGDPKITGKIGTDIETGKCTWLAATAMQICTTDQKRIMEENYGKNNPHNVNIVKGLYIELGLPQLYTDYETKSYENFHSWSQKLSMGLLREVVNNFLVIIYKRTS